MYFLLEHLDNVAQDAPDHWKATCPCHADTNPSLQITLENGQFLCHCFPCGANGKAVCDKLGLPYSALHADYDGAGYVGTGAAVPSVSSKVQTVTSRNAQSEKLGLTLKEYAEAKGFDVDKLKKWGLFDSWWGGVKCPRYNVVKIPYLDENGKPYHINEKGESISIRIRQALKKSHKEKDNRFLWYRGSKPSAYLYGAQYLAKWADDPSKICVVEGESDCHAGWHGKIKVIGLPGAGMWNDAYIVKLLSNYTEIYVFIERKPDGEKDSGGKRLYDIVTGQDGKHNTSALIKKIRFVSVPPELGKDLSDLWLHFGGDADKFHDYVIELLKAGEAYNGAITADAQKTDAHDPDGRSVTSKENGKKGGRPKEKRDPYDIALLFFQKGGLYRYYRDNWYYYDGAQYRSIEAGEMLREILAFLQELNEKDKEINAEKFSEWLKCTDPNKGPFKAVREQEVKVSLGNDVLANLTTKTFYGVDNNSEQPFKILGGGKGEKLPGLWWHCLNGFVNIDVAADRGNKIERGENIEPIDERCFIPNTPEIFSTMTLNVKFEESARNGMIANIWRDMLPDDSLLSLGMMAGMALSWNLKHNVFFVLYGQRGGEGKTTCVILPLQTLFAGCRANVPISHFADNFGLTDLSIYPVNIVDELSDDTKDGFIKRNISGILKQATSGAEGSFDEKFKPTRTKARFTALNIFSSNKLPKYLASDNAMLDRLRIIEFKKRFRDNVDGKQDVGLQEKLLQPFELSALFNIMIMGYGKLKDFARFPDTADGLRRKEQLQVNITEDYIKSRFIYSKGNTLVIDGEKESEYKKYISYCLGRGYYTYDLTIFCQKIEDNINGAIVCTREELRKKSLDESIKMIKNIAVKPTYNVNNSTDNIKDEEDF